MPTETRVPPKAEADPLAEILPVRERGRRTRILGILNLTPDSFHDGGVDASTDESVARARRLVGEGADAIDVGAESSRPGSDGVPAAEELRRLMPVLERVVELGVPVSVDTTKAEVARRALAAGVALVNDISALTFDPEMAEVCAGARGVILMHLRGRPRDMQTRAAYGDVVDETKAELAAAMERAVRAGVPESRIVLDPGIGFAKTAEQSLEILRRLGEYASLGRPVLVGASRKSFLRRTGGETAADRLEATLAVTALAVQRGADVLRVHDVRENRIAIRTAEAVLGKAREESRA